MTQTHWGLPHLLHVTFQHHLEATSKNHCHFLHVTVMVFFLISSRDRWIFCQGIALQHFWRQPSGMCHCLFCSGRKFSFGKDIFLKQSWRTAFFRHVWEKLNALNAALLVRDYLHNFLQFFGIGELKISSAELVLIRLLRKMVHSKSVPPLGHICWQSWPNCEISMR